MIENEREDREVLEGMVQQRTAQIEADVKSLADAGDLKLQAGIRQSVQAARTRALPTYCSL